MSSRPFQQRRWQRRPTAPAPAPPQPLRMHDAALPDMSGLPLEQRLRLADDYAGAHPGRPIATMLLDLFPELRLLNTQDA